MYSKAKLIACIYARQLVMRNLNTCKYNVTISSLRSKHNMIYHIMYDPQKTKITNKIFISFPHHQHHQGPFTQKAFFHSNALLFHCFCKLARWTCMTAALPFFVKNTFCVNELLYLQLLRLVSHVIFFFSTAHNFFMSVTQIGFI